MVIGKRYRLPHGTGVYIGYEEFYDKGYKSRIVESSPPNDVVRRVFKLDPDHNWCNEGNYCAWDRDIKAHVDI